MKDFAYFLVIIYLLDRLLIIRDRYRIAFEYENTKYHKGYWAFWIYKKGMQSDDKFWRHKRLIHAYNFYKIKIK